MAQPAAVPDGLSGVLAKYQTIKQLLRFAAIGVLNTAIDFIILNLLTKYYGIEFGFKLGSVNVIGFTAAVIQSYFWNRYWTFQGGEQDFSIIKNVTPLILVGGLGFAAMAAVLYGAHRGAGPLYFLYSLLGFIMLEALLWHILSLHITNPAGSSSRQFISFIVVSLIGLAVNSILLALLSKFFIGLLTGTNVDLIKNAAKIFATACSLIWNFIGYKLAVFKN